MQLVRWWGHRGGGTQSQVMSSKPKLLAIGVFYASLGQFCEARTVTPFLDVNEEEMGWASRKGPGSKSFCDDAVTPFGTMRGEAGARKPGFLV